MTVSAPSSRSWMQHKEEGKVEFQRKSYQHALKSYRAALNASNCPSAEKQILLSNIVACRLKIGGPAMAAAAVEEAKQCIVINARWAKGHIRLASAYIELGDHSNDACNALQRAISLDPTNQTARQMLTRELRRDSPPQPSAPPQELDDSQPSQTRDDDPSPAENIDDTVGYSPSITDRIKDYWTQVVTWYHSPSDGENLSITDRIKFYWMRAITWYHLQPNDVKTLLKVGLGIVVLYVMMGGRFGFEKTHARGNYGDGSAYDRYGGGGSNNHHGHQQHSTYLQGAGSSNSYGGTASRGAGSSSNSYGSGSAGGRAGYDSNNGNHQRRADSYDDNYNSYGGRSSRSQSFHFPNLFDGSVPSMICLAGIAYACHLAGINPFQALMMMNMMGGRRGGRGMGGMGGMGMAGMGYGMARNAGMFGNRQQGARPRGGMY